MFIVKIFLPLEQLWFFKLSCYNSINANLCHPPLVCVGFMCRICWSNVNVLFNTTNLNLSLSHLQLIKEDTLIHTYIFKGLGKSRENMGIHLRAIDYYSLKMDFAKSTFSKSFVHKMDVIVMMHIFLNHWHFSVT